MSNSRLRFSLPLSRRSSHPCGPQFPHGALCRSTDPVWAKKDLGIVPLHLPAGLAMPPEISVMEKSGNCSTAMFAPDAQAGEKEPFSRFRGESGRLNLLKYPGRNLRMTN
jgi:hypothetical protein